MGVNREYKDSVFSWLFSDPDTLRELYGALEGVQRILKDFLELHSSEVINMLLTEWNWDDALTVRGEEGREEGQNMVLELLEQGYTPEQIKTKLAAIKTAGTETAGK
jgi:hypothetical protein